MAHMVETMAYAGEVPWHGLGKKVLPDLTPQQMLVEAGLDWEVAKFPLEYVFDDDGTALMVPDKFALVRTTDGMYFDTVGPNWNPLQNEEAFELFHDFVMQGDMEMHTAGSLQNGKIVWGLAKIKDSFRIGANDEIEQYLLFVNPHKRGKAIQVCSTGIRVVCKNTMNFALNSTSSRRIKVNHNQKWDSDYVTEMLGLAHQSFGLYKEAADLLASARYEQAQVQEYFTRVFPNTGSTDEDSKNAIRALDVLHEQPGAELSEGSWWQAFNAVTWMTDHEMGRSVDTRLNSAWFGQNRTRKEKALDLAIEYAEAA
jgi:phage/plasmid-like protein (TIGR03299 family)